MEASDEQPIPFERLLANHTPENQDRLRRKLQELRKRPDTRVRASTKGLYADRELNLESVLPVDSFNKFMSPKLRAPISKPAYETLIKYLRDKQLWTGLAARQELAREPDMLFHTLSGFLGITDSMLLDMISELQGTYWLWRASMHGVPGQFVRGAMHIEYDEASKAVRCRETQAFRGEERTAPRREQFSGYVVERPPYYIFIARDAAGHKGPPRVTMVHNTQKEGGKIVTMFGIVVGSYGENAPFCAPVYLERVEGVDPQALESELEITDNVPALIKAKLQLHVSGDLIRLW